MMNKRGIAQDSDVHCRKSRHHALSAPRSLLGRLRFFVVLARVRGLLLRAKHLFIAALINRTRGCRTIRADVATAHESLDR
jgi:hypothetical protein